MPTISVFYGIQITMNFIQKEHNPPHIHAQYGGEQARFNILNGELLDGNFPITATKLVKEFISMNKSELLKMWEEGNCHKLKGLE